MDIDFLTSLPEEEEEKFILYEKKAREISWEDDFNNMPWFNKAQYVNYMAAFISEHNLDIQIDLSNALQRYDEVESELNMIAARMSLRVAKKRKAATYYVLNTTQKAEIHHYINLIREKIDSVSLDPIKKDALLKRLNAFASDVDRDKTQIQSLGDLFVYAMKRVSEGAKELESTVDLLSKTWGVFTKAEVTLNIKYEKKLSIEPPALKIVGPKREIEDEFPS